MAKRIPDRLSWAVQTLAVDPADRLLEVGCGAGVAVSLICEKLVGGKIVAIDRSEAMIKKAQHANRQSVNTGKSIFQTTSLAEADFGTERFNKIFAVNVNVFWQQPARELRLIKTILEPEGSVYLFYQPPHAGKVREIVEKSRKNFLAYGFAIRDVLVKEVEPVPVVCIGAEAA